MVAWYIDIDPAGYILAETDGVSSEDADSHSVEVEPCLMRSWRRVDDFESVESKLRGHEDECSRNHVMAHICKVMYKSSVT